MALLNATAEDLTTSEGQAQAIQKIIGEFNKLQDTSDLLNTLQVSSYGLIDVAVKDAAPAGKTFTASARHGLGFMPIFLPFYFDVTNNFYISLPFISGITGDVDGSAVETIFTDSYVDSQFIYYEIIYGSNYPSIPADYTAQMFYYIFNIPVST